MLRRAFTMLELVFVIVVGGILAISIIPQLERDNIGEAAHQVARHIRLAQHHALMEDRFDDAPAGVNWRETMWRITFINGTNGNCYNVHADRDGNGGNPAASERAVDPMSKDWVWGGTTCSDTTVGVNSEVLLWKKFGIASVAVCGGVRNIAFDHFGRPGQISSNTMNLLAADCDITITTNDNKSAVVRVYQDTGFIKIVSIDGVAMP